MTFRAKNKGKKPGSSGAGPSALPTLDLHGYQKDEVFDAVDAFIVKNYNRSRVRIMAGKGKGVVAAETRRYLKAGGYPFILEKMSNGKSNDGVLVVILD